MRLLELQYSRICMRVGTARRREAAAIAWRIVRLLGLIEAAELMGSGIFEPNEMLVFGKI